MKKYLISLLLAFILMPAAVVAQTHYNVLVGGGTDENQYVPNYTWYNYAYSQMLYTAAEVGLDGAIDTLAFQVSSGGTTRSLTIYMAEVSATTLSTQVPASAFQQVFSGNVSWTTGWNTIPLDTTFSYGDTGSLVIAIIDGTGSYVSSPYYLGTEMSSTRSKYEYSDIDSYTLSSVMTNSSSFLPNLKLGINSMSSYCARPTDLAVSNIDYDSARISWTENGGATTWEVLLSDTAVTDFSSASGVLASTTSHVFTGLTGNAAYYVYVRAICGTDNSSWNSTMFRSACIGATAVPYSTGFEDLATGQLPNCWEALATGSSGAGNFPAAYEYSSNARNGNVYFEMESNSRQTEVVALPEMSNISSLQLSFYASVMNINFILEAGVIEDDTLFVPVDTITLTAGVGGNWHGSYNLYTVYYDQYDGTGNRMALRVTPSSNNFTLMIDDISIMEIPNCLAPTNFRIASVGPTSVDLTWHDNAEASAWELLLDTVAFNPVTTTRTPLSVFDTNVALTDLVQGATYTAYVRADCGEYSPWTGPVVFTPGQFNMNFSGTDTVRGCGFVIYDDGGEEASYNTGVNSMVVVYPSEDSLIVFSGSYDIYYYYARLRIYEGVGTSGNMLWQSSTEYSGIIPVTRSNSGPITIQFVAGDYNYGYWGFEIQTTCVPAPNCASITNLEAPTVGVSSAYVQWEVSGTNLGEPTGYEVQCIDTAGNTVATASPTEMHTMLTGLTPSTSYIVRARAICSENDASDWDSILVNTSSLACMVVDSANSHFDTVGHGVNYDSYLPSYNYYSYSYTQQIYTADEIGHGGMITALSVLPLSVNTQRTLEIYLAHVTDSTVNNFLHPSDLRLVYEGAPVLMEANQWAEFVLDNPFNYDGVSNLLVCFRDMTGSWTTANTYRTHDNPHGSSRYIYQDGAAYDPATVSGGYSSGQRNDLAISMMACSQLATCAAPVVVVDSAGTDYVSISWGAGYQESIWSVDYRAEGDTGWTSLGNSTANTHIFSPLTVNVRYYFRIGALCTDTTLYTEVNARTHCVVDSVPFVNNFESFPSSGVPSCWYGTTSNTYGTYPSIFNYSAHSGNYSLSLFSSSGTYTYLVLPELNAPVDSLEVTFWMYAANSGNPNDLYVGVMSDPENIGTFHTVGVAHVDQVVTWKPIHVRLDNYTGNGNRIAILSPETDYADLYIDDLEVRYLLPCSNVENVTLVDVDTTNALLTWDSTGNSYFEVAYGPQGSVLDSCTVVTSMADSIRLTGLTPNMAYDVYVRTVCPSGDTSNWTTSYTFRTGCVMIRTLPFAEDFSVVPSGWGGSYVQEFMPCWYRDYDPDGYSQYPYIDSYYGRIGNGLYWYWSTYNYFDPYIVLPAIDTNALPMDTLQLSFWGQGYGYGDVAQLYVGVMSDPTNRSTLQVVDTVSIVGENWALYEVDFANYTGNGNYIALLAANTGDYWTAYFDDFGIDYIPPCPHVRNLAVTGNTANSVSLSWNEHGTATQWQVAIDTIENATPVADTTLNDSTFVTISNLTGGQYYYFWVRAVCGGGDTSAWEGPVMGIPNSWMMRVNQTDTITMCGGMLFDNGGPVGTYSSNQTSTVVLLPPDSTYLISVSGTSYTESTYDYVTILDGDGTELWSDYGVSMEQTFGPFFSSTGSLTINFVSDGSVQYDGFAINVDCISTYCRVMGIRLNDAIPESPNRLALTWNNNGAILYQVEYGEAGFTQGEGTLLSTTTNSIVIPGLDTLGLYDIYVRSVCGVGDTGAWVSKRFQTALCDGQVYVENWDASQTTYTYNYYSPLGYSGSMYAYTQTLIDSAMLANLDGDIIGFGFLPNNTEGGSAYANITVYLANVSESDLGMGFILPDSTHQFVKVLDSADLSYATANWQIHQFDTAFAWDGHSNLLVAAVRNDGYSYYGAMFSSHNTSGAMARYMTDWSNPIDYTNPSGYSYTMYYTGDMRFYTCNGIACPQPMVNAATGDYESATFTWTGEGTAYEVNIKETVATEWPATDIAVSGNSYTFTGLLPETNYTFRVRMDCNADSNGYSEWTYGTFTTDSLPCLTPSNVIITDIANDAAAFDWTTIGNEPAWDVHVWFAGGFDSLYRVNTHPIRLTGFTPGITYNVAVRAVCGTVQLEGDWSDTVNFTTLTCPDVTGAFVSNVAAHSVTITWDVNPSAQGYVIEYGSAGFPAGSGITVTTANNTYEVTGLDSETSYDFHVRAMCGLNWYSENWANITATTVAGLVCDPVQNLTIIDITSTTATATWIPGNVGDTWQVLLTNEADSVLSEATTTDLSYQFTGLTPMTSYVAKVRTFCGTEDYSDYVTYSFSTTESGIDGISAAKCSIYPNPTSSATTISVSGVNGKVQIAIVDMNGRTVASETLECSSDCEKTMDVDHLAQGAYFVRITGESVNMVRKLIVR